MSQNTNKKKFKFRELIREMVEQRLTREMMRYFDWPLFFIVAAITLFGVVCIFSATSSGVTEKPSTIMEMLQTQSIYYPRQHLIMFSIGIAVMLVLAFFPYKLFQRFASLIYVLNIAMLLITLMIAEAGRGGMTAFIGFGNQGVQPSEFGKVAIIICLSRAFTDRKHNISKLSEFIILTIYVGIPLILVGLQPDFGTAMVYLFVFCIMIFVSGTDWRLLASLFVCVLILAIPLWYAMTNSSAGDDFRLTRFLIWLDPESYPDEARQVINAQIAVGSGGLFGKGIVSPGSFASLGYISDDHTDFIFAIVCESFGMVGAFALVTGYALLIGRLIWQAMRVTDPFGAYIIIGAMAMLLFHIVENLCMVIGLLPVTGIPLPFVSYGGSNMVTNMASIGLVQNVIIRTRKSKEKKRTSNTRAYSL